MGRCGEKECGRKRTRLATTWRACNMEELNICTSKWRNLRTNDWDPPLLGTPQNRQNIRINDTELLVARNEERHPKKHSKLQHLSNSETRPTSKGSPLHPNEIPKGPWQVVSVDMMGPLPESKGFDTILVVVDRFTKKSFFLPTNSMVMSKGIVTLYWDRVFSEHGLPKKVISDRGPQFISKFMKELYETMGIKGNPSTAYHPQTDGQMERVNQSVKEFLTMFVNDKQDDWSDWLAIVQFCHNDWKHSAMTYSPFFLTYGYHPM